MRIPTRGKDMIIPTTLVIGYIVGIMLLIIGLVVRCVWPSQR